MQKKEINNRPKFDRLTDKEWQEATNSVRHLVTLARVMILVVRLADLAVVRILLWGMTGMKDSV